jgi:hypothetical protein
MVERRSELNRHYHRKKKMRKLKAKLANAKSDADREKIVGRILTVSPFWTPPQTA